MRAEVDVTVTPSDENGDPAVLLVVGGLEVLLDEFQAKKLIAELRKALEP